MEEYHEENEKVASELLKCKDLVKQCLEEDELCRNSDKWLIISVLRKITKFYIRYEDLASIPEFESIRRCRQLIQSKGEFLPTNPKVIIKRRKREKAFREIIPKIDEL